jgi:hypothetical protein
MTLVLYGILFAVRTSPGGDGIDAQPLRSVRCGKLTAVVSDLPRDLELREESLRAYAGVVESLGRLGTVLPARFGTTFKGDDAVRHFLTAQERRLENLGARVHGALEMGVRLPATGAPRSDARERPGSGYLLGRLGEHRHAEQLATRIEGAAADLVRQSVVRVSPRRGTLLQAAYLVEREATAVFTDRMRALGEDDLVVTGPWQPYSFSGLEPDA